MNRTPLMFAALVSLSVGACGSAIEPGQADGRDCNFLHSAGACGASSFCDPGVAASDGTYPRSRSYGLFGDKSHAVGTCRLKGAAGTPCLTPSACASGTCAHREPNPVIGAPGACE